MVDPAADRSGDVQMGPIMNWIEENTPKNAIFTNGAGNYATWLHRFHRFQAYNTQAAPTSGSMGYGLPAAVAAKQLFPEREVICFAGDGCFMMHGQEFITAVRYQLPIITVLVNNGTYGTIRMHQEREFPAASAPPTSSTRISWRLRQPMAATASGCRRQKTSARPLSAPAPPASRRSSR